MVAIKGWSRYVWNSEQTLTQNVFGRYLSHGSIQIYCSGKPVTREDSSYVQAGWNWNRWPGTTAIRLPLESLRCRCPSRHFTNETFVGGVSLGKTNGLFAMRLNDTVYEKTFRANKSMFCFENRIICLGSNIVNEDAKHPTETTLFQCNLPKTDSPIRINSPQPITTWPYEKTFSKGQKAWLMDVVGNGYYLPDAYGLRVVRQRQNSIRENGTIPTEGNFATAWLDHGKAPDGAGYEYMIVVQPGPHEMAGIASSPGYVVLQKDEEAHVVRDNASGTTGYALFKSSTGIKHGPLTGVDAPCMVMLREEDGRVSLAVTNPDLRLTDKWYAGTRQIPLEKVIAPARWRRLNYLCAAAGPWPLRPKKCRI